MARVEECERQTGDKIDPCMRNHSRAKATAQEREQVKSRPKTAMRKMPRTPSYACAAPKQRADSNTATARRPRARTMNWRRGQPRKQTSSPQPAMRKSSIHAAISLLLEGAICISARDLHLQGAG